jgi:hypothetical protein
MSSQAEVHDVLVRARARIEREEDWYQHDFGRNDGPVCAAGALLRARGESVEIGWHEAIHRYAEYRELNRAMGSRSVSGFNDTHTHAEVLAAFDRAIAATAPEPDTDWLNEVRVEEPVAS